MKLTQNEFETMVENTNNCLEVIGKYLGMKKHVKMKCKICDHEWEPLARNMVGKYATNCPHCSKGVKTKEEIIKKLNEKSERQEKQLKKTNKILEKANKKGILVTNINDSRCKCTCTKCGEEWENILSKAYQYKCECANNIKLTHEEFCKKANELFCDFDIVSRYENNKKPINVKCKLCGYEFEIYKAGRMLSKRYPEIKCPNCGTGTETFFREKLAKVKPYIKVIGEYKGNKEECTFLNTECGHMFSVRADHIYRTDCTICSQSLGERTIERVLNLNKIEFEKQKTFEECSDVNKLRFDFYIESKNTCIEYDGEQHFRPIDYFGGNEAYEKSKKRDLIKDNYCKQHNIKLIRIPFSIQNIEEYLINELAL